jgi:hypothetical protein
VLKNRSAGRRSDQNNVEVSSDFETRKSSRNNPPISKQEPIAKWLHSPWRWPESDERDDSKSPSDGNTDNATAFASGPPRIQHDDDGREQLVLGLGRSYRGLRADGGRGHISQLRVNVTIERMLNPQSAYRNLQMRSYLANLRSIRNCFVCTAVGKTPQLLHIWEVQTRRNSGD